MNAYISQGISVKKVVGSCVELEPNNFLSLVSKHKQDMVFVSEPTFFNKTYCYSCSYSGYILLTRSKTQLPLSQPLKLIKAKQIWFPDYL